MMVMAAALAKLIFASVTMPARSALGPKAEKLKAKQWGFSSEKTELFACE